MDNSQDEMYNSRNPLVRYGHNKRAEEVIKLVLSANPKRVLEIGCGEGFLLEKLSRVSDAELFGAEISSERIRLAKNKGFACTFKECDVVSLPFEDNFFDLVIASEILEHISDYKKAVGEIKRVVNGSIVVSFPNELVLTLGRLCTGRFPICYPNHVNSFKPSDFVRLLGEPLEYTTVPHLPFLFSLNFVARYDCKKKDLVKSGN